MTKRKALQLMLWFTAVLVTAFFTHIPFVHIPLYKFILYGLCVFLPQAITILCQFKEVNERYREALKNTHNGFRVLSHDKAKFLWLKAENSTANSFALLKSGGINPNRAGPAFSVG